MPQRSGFCVTHVTSVFWIHTFAPARHIWFRWERFLQATFLGFSTYIQLYTHLQNMKPVNILVFSRDHGVWLKVSRRLCKARRDRVFHATAEHEASVSWFGLVVRLVSGRTSVWYPIGSPFCWKKVVVCGHGLVTLSITSYWNIKMALIAAHLNAAVILAVTV